MPAAFKLMKPLPEPEERLETLFREQHARIVRTAYRVTGSMSDAEDVLQSVFLRLIRNGEEAHSIENAEAYLQRAAVNASLDLLRGRQRARAIGLDDLENEHLRSPFGTPEAQQADLELRKLIQAAVARLGKKSAEMFALRYYEGYDNHEIAKLLNTSQMVVGVLLHRARVRLRKEIGVYMEKHHEAK